MGFYQKIGVYSTGITRYINYENIDNIEKCFEEKGRTTDENTALYTLYQKKIKLFLQLPVQLIA